MESQQPNQPSQTPPAKRSPRRWWAWGVLIVIGLAVTGLALGQPGQPARPAVQAQTRQQAKRPHLAKRAGYASKARPARLMRTPIDWHKPSETAAYPVLTGVKDLSMTVRLDRQRVYIRGNGKRLYTMYASTGVAGRTPAGHFRIGQRGLHFFNPSPAVRLGANYWTSIYQNRILFHTVPFDAQGHYDLKEANDLGLRAGSHGCVQLSIPDAKWIYDKIPEGTPVVISRH
ncbi:L,D-transpeptidase [Lacticaseibacillus jixianensis]|uniref:L,D-transpeptidase n=1 Tax=Lacticaseibacillus jixianensis TaxID=2486012 RepID=A0ABW4B771_9LACO|nr:L,D-transpeptidase [Lacticaseibacillus jixianensis]